MGVAPVELPVGGQVIAAIFFEGPPPVRVRQQEKPPPILLAEMRLLRGHRTVVLRRRVTREHPAL